MYRYQACMFWNSKQLRQHGWNLSIFLYIRPDSIAHKLVSTLFFQFKTTPVWRGLYMPSLQGSFEGWHIECYCKVKCPIFVQLPGRNPEVLVCSMP